MPYTLSATRICNISARAVGKTKKKRHTAPHEREVEEVAHGRREVRRLHVRQRVRARLRI